MIAVVAGAVVGVVGVAAIGIQALDQVGPVRAAAAGPVVRPGSTARPSPAAGRPAVSGHTDQTAAGETHSPVLGAVTAIEVPSHGPGTYRTAKLNLPAPPGHGRVVRFDVRIERGLDLEPDEVARNIAGTLADPHSWRTTDHVRFQLVSNPRRARLHAYVVTPGTTDRLCYPWLTRGAVSCQNGNRVVLNAKRWVHGAKAYGSDLVGYREYLVNHEFGHSLGYNHVHCPGKGRPAPVMMQQTKGLDGCRPNPWPAVGRR